MSFIHMDATTASSAGIAVVTLTSATASDTDFFRAEAGFQFKSNGTVFKYEHGITAQVASATDWIQPRVGFSDGASYEVRGVVSSGGEDIGNNSTTWGVWHPIGANQLLTRQCERFCVSLAIVFFDIRFGDGTDPKNNVTSLAPGGASVMASTSYFISLSAN